MAEIEWDNQLSYSKIQSTMKPLNSSERKLVIYFREYNRNFNKIKTKKMTSVLEASDRFLKPQLIANYIYILLVFHIQNAYNKSYMFSPYIHAYDKFHFIN